MDLAQHVYFNLAGHPPRGQAMPSALAHELHMSAGQLASHAAGIPAIFRRATGAVGARLAEFTVRGDRAEGPAAAAREGASPPSLLPEQREEGDSFILTAAPSDCHGGDGGGGGGLRHLATLRDPGSGRTLTVESDAPAGQVRTTPEALIRALRTMTRRALVSAAPRVTRRARSKASARGSDSSGGRA